MAINLYVVYLLRGCVIRFNSLLGIHAFRAMLWSVMPVFERGRNSGNSGNSGISGNSGNNGEFV